MTPPGTVPADAGGSGSGRTMRADARRNRTRILEAAEVVFATEGASASTEEIARRAGIGIGTVFRHFPTKEALLEAIVLGRVRRLIEDTDALVAAGDPATSLFTFFARAAEEAAAKKAFTELLASGFVDIDASHPELRQHLRQKIETLLARAQEAGTVREDVRLPEVMALFIGTLRMAEHTKKDDELRERTLEILLDGLRPAGRR